MAGIAIALGVNPIEASSSTLLLLLWVWFAHQAGPSPKEDPEYAYLRNVRVKLYFVGLLLYIFLALAVLAISPIGALFLYGVLTIIRAGILIALFLVLVGENAREIGFRDKAEQTDFREMVSRVGESTINLAWSLLAVIVLVNIETYGSGPLATAQVPELVSFVFTTMLAVLAVAFLSRRAFVREMQSRHHAEELADSLRRRRWNQRFQRKS